MRTKWKQKAFAMLVSAAMCLNLGAADGMAFAAGEEIPAPAEKTSELAPAGQHAYDPIAEREAEQAYRDSTKVAAHRLLFSVLDERTDGEEAVY